MNVRSALLALGILAAGGCATGDRLADQAPACEGVEEWCNGVDDDCDGVVDESPAVECAPQALQR